MKAAKLRKLLERTGITQREAAKRLEVSERQMRRYASGEAKIPKVIEICLYSMVLGWMEKQGIDYLADEALLNRTRQGAHPCSDVPDEQRDRLKRASGRTNNGTGAGPK